MVDASRSVTRWVRAGYNPPENSSVETDSDAAAAATLSSAKAAERSNVILSARSIMRSRSFTAIPWQAPSLPIGKKLGDRVRRRAPPEMDIDIEGELGESVEQPSVGVILLEQRR
jgi:hypothetical protein